MPFGANYMTLPALVLRNGKLVLPAQANISVFNPALYGAHGVYESLQVVNGTVFEQVAHVDRLMQSAGLLGITVAAPRSTVDGWLHEVLDANHARDCVLRMLVLGAGLREESVTFVWPQEAPVYPAPLYDPGAGVITFEGERFLPSCKSLNTLVSSLARRRAVATGAHEAFLHHGGHLTEGSNSNLFVVIEDELLTPPAAQVLPGVTRDVVLRLADKYSVPYREVALPLASVPRWSECFITSTNRHVMPVAIVDGRPVGSGRPGPTTQRVAGLFEEYFCEATAGQGK
jgi:branched-subunit amino acid aminotransferase/4-amino-4-deoxychorismate lyase